MLLRSVRSCAPLLLSLALLGSSAWAEAAPDAGTPTVDQEDLVQARKKIAEHVVGLERHLKQLQQSLRARIERLEDGSTDERSRLERELARAQKELGETVSRLKKSAEVHLNLLEKDIEQERKRAKDQKNESKTRDR